MAITPGEVLHSWRNRAAKQGFITRNHFLTCTFLLFMLENEKLHFITNHAKEERESLYHGSHELLLIDTLFFFFRNTKARHPSASSGTGLLARCHCLHQGSKIKGRKNQFCFSAQTRNCWWMHFRSLPIQHAPNTGEKKKKEKKVC